MGNVVRMEEESSELLENQLNEVETQNHER